MVNYLNINETLFNDDYIFVDVRSPIEFSEDTIPNAINIPILDDKEREKVGYIYKRMSPDKAKVEGIEYASKRLVHFYNEINKLIDHNKKIILFCYRGGIRSNSVANFLSSLGVNINLLQGGYKSYRKYINDNLCKHIQNKDLIVLHGHTGVGKTILLNILQKKNYPVINLENLACNSGSVFGELAFENNSTTQKNFESLLFEKVYNLKSNMMFIESESRRLGRIILPKCLIERINNGKHILITTSVERRISNIMSDYVYNNINNKDVKFIEAINKLRSKLGEKNTEELVENIKKKNYKFVVEELMMRYYDNLYDYSIKKINKYDLTIDYKEIDDAVNELINYTNKL